MKSFRIRLPWLLFIFGAVAASCGTKEGNPPPDPLANRGGFCGQWGKVACSAQVQKDCAASSAEKCIDAQDLYCRQIVDSDAYSPEFAEQCLEAVKAAYADARLTAEELGVVTKLAEPCDKLLTGAGVTGDACSRDFDCDTHANLRCVLRPTGEGTCQEPVEVEGGFPCTSAEQVCKTGLYCDGTNCLARKAEGAACDTVALCREDLKCEGTPGTCVARAGNAEDCANDADCVSNICAKSTGVATGKCVNDIILQPTNPLCDNLN
jgi:hypothetical protein